MSFWWISLWWISFCWVSFCHCYLHWHFLLQVHNSKLNSSWTHGGRSSIRLWHHNDKEKRASYLLQLSPELVFKHVYFMWNHNQIPFLFPLPILQKARNLGIHNRVHWTGLFRGYDAKLMKEPLSKNGYQ